MATPADPTLVRVEDFEVGRRFDEYNIDESRRLGTERLEKIPRHFADATVTDPTVQAWVVDLIKVALDSARVVPVISHGPSLRLHGPTGTGKSHQAYGALRALAASGVRCSWIYTTAADVYAALRPRDGVDAEVVFERYAKIPLLVLDDLGAAKSSEWNEEVNYRLINYRYENERPTLFISNLSPRELADILGERITSRIAGMSTPAVLKGDDRRKGR